MSKLAFRAQTVDIAYLPFRQDLFAKNVLVSFKSVGMNHSEECFTFERRSWLFLRGDISKKIPRGLAVVTYVGFIP